MKWKWLSINEWKQMPIISMANRKHHSILIRNGMNWFAANDPFHGWWFLLHLVAVMNLDCIFGWPFLYTHCRALNIITYFLMSPMCVNVLCAVRACKRINLGSALAKPTYAQTQKKSSYFSSTTIDCLLYCTNGNQIKRNIYTHTHARIHEIRLISMFIHGVLTIIKLLVVWTFGHFSFGNLKSKGIEIKTVWSPAQCRAYRSLPIYANRY